MGEHVVARPENEQQARAFMRAILADIRALDLMIERGMVEQGVRRLGVEQEMYLVDAHGMAAPVATRLMERVADPRFQTEVALFNLEANLGPQRLEGSFLRDMHQELNDVLDRARQAAGAVGADVVLTGMLPTLRREDVTASNLTPEIRYRCLNEASLATRGGELNLEIDGVDRFQSKFKSVVVEGANTSIQLHLQVGPEEAARQYNLAQLITAPLVAAAGNSPILLGERLWCETRIAVFERAFDDRSVSQLGRGVPTRVGFGGAWIQDSLVELFRDNVARYPVIMTRPLVEDPLEVVEAGRAPQLVALGLHNGTVWRWNRPCYGITDGKPHLRIENRALPAGPSVLDEVANAALFYGLMLALDAAYGDVSQQLPFAAAKANFLASAQRGLKANFQWLDGRKISARELLLKDLIPAARKGLASVQVPDEDVGRYLDVVNDRVESGRTGAQWLLESLSAAPEQSRRELYAAAVQVMLAREQGNEPVHRWELAAAPAEVTVAASGLTLGDIMTTDVFTVRPDDVIDLAASVMGWRHIRHVPVEDTDGKLVGLITARELLRLQELAGRGQDQTIAVADLMDASPPTGPVHLSLLEGMRHLLATDAGCLLVVRDAHLVGIVTERDLVRAAYGVLEQSAGSP